MRRITISLADDLAHLAEAEVKAGRAPSVSAWVADAIRSKARARAELVAELEQEEGREPTSAQSVSALAHALGLPRPAVARALKSRRSGRRAA